MNKSYVYILLDPRKPGIFKYNDNVIFEYEPFYIGQSRKKNRINHHFIEKDCSNGHKFNKIKKIQRETSKNPIAIKFIENVSDKKAKAIEIKLIKLIGRFDLNLGPLTNMTDGGDGTSKIVTQETRNKISKANKGLKRSQEVIDAIIARNTGKKFTKRHKARIGKAHKGKVYTPEVLLKLSLNQPNRKPVLQYDKNLNFIKEFQSTYEASKASNLARCSIAACCKNRIKSSGGFIWKFKNE